MSHSLLKLLQFICSKPGTNHQFPYKTKCFGIHIMETDPNIKSDTILTDYDRISMDLSMDKWIVVFFQLAHARNPSKVGPNCASRSRITQIPTERFLWS